MRQLHGGSTRRGRGGGASPREGAGRHEDSDERQETRQDAESSFHVRLLISLYARHSLMRRSFHRLSHAVYSHAVYAKALSLSKGDWLPKLALLSIRIPAGQR